MGRSAFNERLPQLANLFQSIALTGLTGWPALRYLDQQVVLEKRVHPAE